MLVLPKNEKAYVEAVLDIADRGNADRQSHMAEWIISFSWLQGVRDWTRDEETYGFFRPSKKALNFIDDDGKLRLRWEDVLRLYQTEFGRFLSIDVRPSVKMLGWGLDRLRGAGIAQTLLDFRVPDRVIRPAYETFLETWLTFGMAGVMGQTYDYAGLSREALDIAGPWEILPLVPGSSNPHTCYGIIRDRILPLEGLKKWTQLADQLKRADDKELQVREMPWNEWRHANSMTDAANPSSRLYGLAGAAMGQRFQSVYAGDAQQAAKHKEGRRVVPVREVYESTTDGLLRHYSLVVGKKRLVFKNFEEDGQVVYMPWGLSRYYASGFYGRSYVSPLIHMSAQNEKNYEAINQTIRDFDWLGAIGFPMSAGIPREGLRIASKPRILPVDWDPLTRNDQQPFQFSPRNPGSILAQGLQLGEAAVDRIASQPAILNGEAMGRIESRAAYGFVLEASNVSIEAAGSSIANAFTRAYTSLLATAKEWITASQLGLVVNLDSIPVGVVVDDKGGYDLSRNPIPSPESVQVGIKSRQPPSPTQIMETLNEQLKLQVIDHQQYRLAIYRKGLDTPIVDEHEYNSWRKIRLVIRLLFNDGKTPQPDAAKFLPSADRIDIAMQEMKAFMSAPEFAMASQEVVDAFDEYLNLLEDKDSEQGFDQRLTQMASIAGQGGQRIPMGS